MPSWMRACGAKHCRSGRIGNIMSSGISNLLPSVLKAGPALQDGQWAISYGK